jgi:hypothetical protein
LEALVQTPAGKRIVVMEPALSLAPSAYKGSLAFYRLARALGMRVVPFTVVRAVPIAELEAAVGGDRVTRVLIGDVRVQNDGTVDVLLATRASPSGGSAWDAPAGMPFDVIEGAEVEIWDRWAASPVPAFGEDSTLLRDYLEMLVLDYLAANVARRNAFRSGPSALTLSDNSTAFPAHVEHMLLDRLLRRLRAAARYPRGLYDALRRFDRGRATRTFNDGPFEGWLLSPRTVIAFDERRAALLTLKEARIAERGAAAVLTLRGRCEGLASRARAGDAAIVIDARTLRSWIEAADCEATPEDGGVLRIRPRDAEDAKDQELPPFYAQLSDNWVLLSMLPMLKPREYGADDLARRLLAANRVMRLAKYARDKEGAVVLCAELPTESLDASEIADAVRRMLEYARRFRSDVLGPGSL